MSLGRYKVFLTGATGFVGRALAVALVRKNYDVTTVVRSESSFVPDRTNKVVVDNLSTIEHRTIPLSNVEVVIHLAARAHIIHDTEMDPLAEYRKVNKDATLALARHAATAKVKRFIFISSIKVNGECTEVDKLFKPISNYIPSDDYGLSKYEAEQGLLKIAEETGMNVVIIRPPLVYGPGVKANFLSMIEWVSRGVPLPFGLVNNKRSFIALDNLVDFIIHCINHPKAANEIFLISDGEDVSTAELLRKVADAFGKKAKLLPIPVKAMSFAAKVIGKKEIAARLFGSLQVDSSKARELLGWEPIITMDEQLKKTVDAYLNEKTI